ncbi:hypothetical protein [Streptomyces candidus]|uniref:Uncharacterized protein n=1 Tax=Streptomyces candidus TaxID=67283 RepID=A0A7X0HJ30_9ACTN|nr:hypothetical protein [Streptomyces candidus]MBB6438591.1 hypothetical protein [Streptomyces candidus]GHH45385.1 hypothetical protein GCM10018773_34610 [Streptomyces candidus]
MSAHAGRGARGSLRAVFVPVRPRAPVGTERGSGGLFGGTQDPSTPLADLRAWNDLVAVPAEPRLFPGAHMYPAQEVAGLAGEVVRGLDAVAPRAALVRGSVA